MPEILYRCKYCKIIYEALADADACELSHDSVVHTIKDLTDNIDTLINDYKKKSKEYPRLHITDKAFPCNIIDMRDVAEMPRKRWQGEQRTIEGIFRGHPISRNIKILRDTIISTTSTKPDSFDVAISIPGKPVLTYTYHKDNPLFLVIYGIETRNPRSVKLNRFAFVTESELYNIFEVHCATAGDFAPPRCFLKDNGASYLLRKRIDGLPHYNHAPCFAWDIGERISINLSYFIRKIPEYGVDVTRDVLRDIIASLCMKMPNQCLDDVTVEIKDDSFYSTDYDLCICIGKTVVASRYLQSDNEYDDTWLELTTRRARPIWNIFEFPSSKSNNFEVTTGIPYCINTDVEHIWKARHNIDKINNPYILSSIQETEERFARYAAMKASSTEEDVPLMPAT